MLRLVPVNHDGISDFEDTSYARMSIKEQRRMVQESLDKCHCGAYFELLAISDGDQIVGLMSLFGPEIKKRFRAQGYGFQAETLALQYAWQMGYSIASAAVREDNAASIALHEKLGFAVTAHRISRHGNPVRVYEKHLD